VSEPLVVFGGTFDPPHIGHLVAAECARVQFGAQCVLFIPAGDPYQKRDSNHEPSPAALRLAMAELAIAGNPAFVLDDREVRRPGPSYAVDTLRELRAEGQDRIILVVGSDAWAGLNTWKEPTQVRQLARIAVAPKEGAPLPGPGAERVAMPGIHVTSTLIRQRVAAGLPIRYLVPDAVEAYIREHSLYRDAVAPDGDRLR
jgi:nicotinate-nucleotide adenylyltransferase